MSKESTQVVEINGVKLELDMRTANLTRIEHISIGTRVRLLKTSSYGGSKIHTGVVVGFEPFKKLPTIIVAYLEDSYTEVKLEFLYYNNETKDTELLPVDVEEEKLNKQKLVGAFDRDIAKKERELADLQSKKAYFLENFGKLFAAHVAA